MALQVNEVNVRMKINKCTNDVNLSISVHEEGVEVISLGAKVCKELKVKKLPSSQKTLTVGNGSEAAGTVQNSTTRSVEAVDCETHNNAYLIHSAANSSVQIGCLETIASLQKKCTQLGIKGNFGYQMTSWYKQEMRAPPMVSGQAGQYAVERIIDHDTDNHLYLIKWLGYGNECNTWEPIDHLDSIADSVNHFRLMEMSLSTTNLVAFKKLILLHCTLNELISLDNQDPYILLKLNGRSAMDYKPLGLLGLKNALKSSSKSLPGFLMEKKENVRHNYLHIFEKALKDLNIITVFKSFENFQRVSTLRKQFFKRLKKFEMCINHTILQEEKGSPPIEIENNCDLDLPPNNFTYIVRNKSRFEVKDNFKKHLWRCSCAKNCSSNGTTCCPGINNTNSIYDKRGYVKNFQQTKIFECNSDCKCSSACPNRVIQKGRKVKLGMFKSEDGRGWGVKALELIPKGQFIIEYVGEIITNEEAYLRSTLGGNPINKSFLFDLSQDTDENNSYLIDGEKFGNISRFLNHSCSPNLEVFMFWVNNSNLKIPGMAFFSKKIIAEGNELTFDYRMTASQADEPPAKKVPCKCMTANCRKYLF